MFRESGEFIITSNVEPCVVFKPLKLFFVFFYTGDTSASHRVIVARAGHETRQSEQLGHSLVSSSGKGD